MNELSRLLELVPDIPRYVEARSLLLSDEYRIFGQNHSQTSFVIASRTRKLAAVIGRPDDSSIIEAAHVIDPGGAILATPENQPCVAAALPEWRAEIATIFTLERESSLPAASGMEVRPIDRIDIDTADVTVELRKELIEALQYSPVFATIVDGKPVSFCYAGSQTRTLWDVSIDTVEHARRHGYARHCVAHAIRQMRPLTPVWGALESNTASLKLAEQLGFARADQLVVFEKPRLESLPVIDISTLRVSESDHANVARAIARACREFGFFYISNHGVSEPLQQRLVAVSQQFFSLSTEKKLSIRMSLGGPAWRGYFPVGDELTSGKPDRKEGIYFGEELPLADERVAAGVPMHGPNLFPEYIPGFRETILDYMAAMKELGTSLMRGIALSLELDESFFETRYTADPFVLFRIFNYPPSNGAEEWGVAEHTDYGVLTILKQDDTGGLEVRVGDRWIAAPPIPNTFVCNIGDMLDRMTGGRYRSTPHRVRNATANDRLSFPFFFDPNFSVRIQPIEGMNVIGHEPERWDKADVHQFDGTYGDYLLKKVQKVFPELHSSVVENSLSSD